MKAVVVEIPEQHHCHERLKQEWTILGQKLIFAIEADSDYRILKDSIFISRNELQPSGIKQLGFSSVAVQRFPAADLARFLDTAISGKKSEVRGFNFSNIARRKASIRGSGWEVFTLRGEGQTTSLHRTEVGAGFNFNSSYLALVFLTINTVEPVTDSQVDARLTSFELETVDAPKSWFSKFLGL